MGFSSGDRQEEAFHSFIFDDGRLDDLFDAFKGRAASHPFYAHLNITRKEIIKLWEMIVEFAHIRSAGSHDDGKPQLDDVRGILEEEIEEGLGKNLRHVETILRPESAATRRSDEGEK